MYQSSTHRTHFQGFSRNCLRLLLLLAGRWAAARQAADHAVTIPDPKKKVHVAPLGLTLAARLAYLSDLIEPAERANSSDYGYLYAHLRENSPFVSPSAFLGRLRKCALRCVFAWAQSDHGLYNYWLKPDRVVVVKCLWKPTRGWFKQVVEEAQVKEKF